MCRRFIKVGIACWAVSIVLGGIARAQTYTVLTLEQNSCAFDINNQFQILATSLTGIIRYEVVIWDRTGRHHTGIDVSAAPDLRLKLNDAGAIAGLAHGQLFVWADGTTTFLPIPTDRTGIPDGVRKFTNSGIVLFSTVGGRSQRWAFHVPSSRLFDLDALTGAVVSDINDDGLMGGYTPGGGPYLRFPDGRTAVPWPEELSQVDRVGPSGHFAGGNVFFGRAAVLLYGSPDGSVTRIRIADRGPVAVLDINRRGDVLGLGDVYPRPFLYTGGRLVQPPGFPIAINDAGYMVGTHEGQTCPRLELLIPDVTAPAGVSFRIAGRTVTLNWQETYGALDYILEAGNAAGAADIFVGSIGPRTAFTATVPAGRYYVRLRARNDAGTGPASAEMVIDVP